MRQLLFRWLVTAVAIFFVPQIVPGIELPGFAAALTMSAILGVLNLFVKPILVVLTLPLTMLTLGVFYLVINALLFMWAGNLVQGVVVASFRDAFFASVVVSFVSWALHLRRGPSPSRIVWMRGGANSGASPQASSRRQPQSRPAAEAKRQDDDTIELHESDRGKWE